MSLFWPVPRGLNSDSDQEAQVSYRVLDVIGQVRYDQRVEVGPY